MSTVRSGGLSTLSLLGHVDGYGNATQYTDQTWCMDENGNPEDIIGLTRDFMCNHDIMFLIERGFNRNICYYKFDEDMGVIPSWLMIPEDMVLEDMSIEEVDSLEEEDLTFMERRVYGVDMIDDTHFTVRALKGEIFTIYQDDEGHARARATIDNTPQTIRRIMIHTVPGTLRIPTVSEIHIEAEFDNKVSQYFYKV